jgi:hypothetical protein
MKVERIVLYYPSGQEMMRIGPLEGSVDDIIKISAAGLEDLINRLPELTKHAKAMFEEYEKSKTAANMKI